MNGDDRLKFVPIMYSFGRVHAYVLAEGDDLTFFDALHDVDARSIFSAIQSLGRQAGQSGSSDYRRF